MDADPFVDRLDELNYLCNLLNRSKRPSTIVVNSQRATGLSRFLERSSRNFSRDMKALRASCGSQSIFISLLLGIRKSVGQDILRAAATHIGKEHAFETLISLVPYLGRTINFTRQMYHDVGFGDQNLPRDIVFSYLKNSSKRFASQYIFVDNVEVFSDEVAELMSFIANDLENKPTLILGGIYANSMDRSDYDLPDRVFEMNENMFEMEFAAPDKKFIEQYINTVYPKCNISASEIFEQSGGNIYRIRRIVKTQCHDDRDLIQFLDIGGEFIIVCMQACKSPLRKTDLAQVAMNLAELSHIETCSELDKVVSTLEQQCIIKPAYGNNGEIFIHLISNSYFTRLEEVRNYLRICSNLYRYFERCYQHSDVHPKSELILLLYNLSGIVDQSSSSHWARQLVRVSMRMGNTEVAYRQIGRVIDIERPKTKDDLIIDVSLKFMCKRYSKVYELLTKLENRDFVSSNRYLRALEALSLNRCRQHDSSNTLIDTLVNTSSSIDEQCILISAKLSNLIHQNFINDARLIFRETKPLFLRSKFFPYFLRMSPSIHGPQEGKWDLIRAYKLFKNNNDHFGTYTTLSNIGLLFLELSRVRSALTILCRSREELIIYGPHHSIHVKNNIGIARVFQGNFDDAIRVFRPLCNGHQKMPSIYASINSAVALALVGDVEKATNMLDEILNVVQAYPVDRVRQRFWHNQALISTIGCFDNPAAYQERADAAIQKMKVHVDRRDPHKTLATAGQFNNWVHGEFPKNFQRDHFSIFWQPCYLEYWYHDPLNLLYSTEGPISPSIGNDVAN